jgi:hypothetical protein
VGVGAAAATGLAEEHVDEKDTDGEVDGPQDVEDDRRDDDVALPGTTTISTGAGAPGGIEQEHEPDRAIATHDYAEREDDNDAAMASISAGTAAAAARRTGEDRRSRGDLEGFSSSYEPHPVDQSNIAVERDTTESAAEPIASPREDQQTETDLSDDEPKSSNKGKAVAATAGIAALGGIIAAGALGAERRRKQQEEDEAGGVEQTHDDVSSLSSSDDDEERPGLYPVASAEHTGQYTFAAPSTGLTTRPDLERHISTIQDSSSEADADDESDELSDSDDDQFIGREAPTSHLEEPVAEPVYVDRAVTRELESEELRPRTYEDTSEDEQKPITPLTPAPTRVMKDPDQQQQSGPLSEAPLNDNGNIVIVRQGAELNHPILVTEEAPASQVQQEPEKRTSTEAMAPTEPEAPQEVAVVRQSAELDHPLLAPIPVAPQSGPSDEERGKQKESKGIRGFFSKLRNKSKADNKLHKEQRGSGSQRTPSAGEQPAPAPAPVKEEDKTITPVTTTTAGLAADGKATDGADPSTSQQPESQPHVGTDGPIGDPTHISGIAGNPRAESPSSFRRGENELRDLDDVSSSGADEDDYARGRGRGGRLRKKLGLAKGRDRDDTETEKPALAKIDTTKTETSEEQFEEARDHFDEGLAPPPAFTGQKSESPSRITKFQEQL